MEAGVLGVTPGRADTHFQSLETKRSCQGLESREQGEEVAAAQVRPAEGAEGTEGKARRQEWRGVRLVEEVTRRDKKGSRGGAEEAEREERHVAWAQGAWGHRGCAAGRLPSPHGAQSFWPFRSTHMASVPPQGAER